jgi:hypothetical protein
VRGPSRDNVATWLLHQSVPATAKARTNPLGNDPAEIAAAAVAKGPTYFR